MGKNGEAAALKRLGYGVRYGTGLIVAGLLKSELFSFARLFAISHEFRDIIRMVTPDTEKMIATVPGEVGHRLKIMTILATVVDEYYYAIGYALEIFCVAYSPKANWKGVGGARQSTLTHAHEVYQSLMDPRYRIWCAFLRRMHPFSELWWGLSRIA